MVQAHAVHAPDDWIDAPPAAAGSTVGHPAGHASTLLVPVTNAMGPLHEAGGAGTHTEVPVQAAPLDELADVVEAADDVLDAPDDDDALPPTPPELDAELEARPPAPPTDDELLEVPLLELEAPPAPTRSV